MNRQTIKLLVVDDNDVHCKTPTSLTHMNLDSLNFIPADLDKYDMIVYQGKRGMKILKSRYTDTGTLLQD